MRVSKPKEPKKIVCIDCGCIFTALTTKAIRCEECRIHRRRKCHREYLAQERERNRIKQMPHLRPKLSMAEVLRKREEYNKEHKTHLSYGKFVQMLEANNGNY